MTLYSVALFLHIVGALGLFAALGLEWTSMRQLRRATTAEQAHEWLNALGLVRRMGPASLAAIFLSGLYMVATAWGIVAWIAVALGAMLLLPPLGAFNGLRLAAIGRAMAAQPGPLSADVRQRLRDPLLWTSVQTRAAIVLGIVFLMTVKPDLNGALLMVATAVVLGLASSWPAWDARRVETPETSAA